MANHKSAVKRAKQSEIKRVQNKSYKTKMKKAVKEVRAAVENNSEPEAQESLKKAVSIIQKTSSKGVIHKNQASRKISRLQNQVNQLAASEG